ncbi:tRNA(Met) cytidine acetyltransferase TmcA [Photobacterium swingsii]|uniref:tRNA(Met) cytidine acetyltransferase TmcA n=1 Tax=Photobacterium swingsii TaxID=680026 RepID=UPI00406843C6
MAKPQHYSTRIISVLHRCNHRALVVLEGDLTWQLSQVSSFAEHYHAPLWLGNQAELGMASVNAKKAKNWLGQEVDCLVVDANQDFFPDAFGMLSGTVVGGGVVLLLVAPPGDDEDKPSWQWLRHQFVRNDCFHIKQAECLSLATVNDDKTGCPQHSALANLPLQLEHQVKRFEDIAADSVAQRESHGLTFGCITQDQVCAVEAIRKVVLGHRKRPLVLTADRGRGKSSALGLAAASLMLERDIKIVVTAPSFATVDTLFAHTRNQLNLQGGALQSSSAMALIWNKSSLQFVAPDRLLEQEIECDFLIVDEAAAIPSPLLVGLLSRYNRIAFASTIHGYEGTGRGFAIKFRGYLDKLMPQWRELHIKQAVRWAELDPLECWVFETLLLNAEMTPLAITDTSLSVDSEARECSQMLMNTISYHLVTTAELLANPSQLVQIFGLLINAHYQTSPADFFQILDDDALLVWVARYENKVVGCCLLSVEGQFTSELAQQVMLGQRRPKGHLLPQSIAAHIGLAKAAAQLAGRIQRIAVHPSLWRNKVGQQLLVQVTDWANEQDFDYLGTSFGVAQELVGFWQYSGFSVIRLGVTKDAASGCYSALAVKPLSPLSQSWFRDAQVLFSLNFHAQCQEQFSDLDVATLRALYCVADPLSSSNRVTNEALVFQQLSTYVSGGLGYDTAVGSLEWLVKRWLTHTMHDSAIQEEARIDEVLVINKIIQKHTWSSIINEHHFVGRKQAEAALREQVSRLLRSFHLPDNT